MTNECDREKKKKINMYQFLHTPTLTLQTYDKQMWWEKKLDILYKYILHGKYIALMCMFKD